MNFASTRIFLGCVAGALAMLIFHQTTLQFFFWFGINPHQAFRIAHVPPFHLPLVVSMTIWGALYGGLFGLVCPRLPHATALRGLIAGGFATLMAWFVVRPLGGHGIAYDWHATQMAYSAAANLAWGFGVALIAPLLNPRCLISRSRAWAISHHFLAT